MDCLENEIKVRIRCPMATGMRNLPGIVVLHGKSLTTADNRHPLWSSTSFGESSPCYLDPPLT